MEIPTDDPIQCDSSKGSSTIVPPSNVVLPSSFVDSGLGNNEEGRVERVTLECDSSEGSSTVVPAQVACARKNSDNIEEESHLDESEDLDAIRNGRIDV